MSSSCSTQQRLEFAGRDYAEVVNKALGKLGPDAYELVTVYRGKDASDEDMKDLESSIRSSYPSLEIEVQHGGFVADQMRAVGEDLVAVRRIRFRPDGCPPFRRDGVDRPVLCVRDIADARAIEHDPLTVAGHFRHFDGLDAVLGR